MKKKKVTSTDIARKAGVSQSTVSMVLNKKYNVSFSKETIERVEKAAKELGYARRGVYFVCMQYSAGPWYGRTIFKDDAEPESDGNYLYV